MITTAIEALLFASGKPLALATLQKTLDVSREVIAEAIADIRTRFNTETSGIHLLEHEGKVQFVTNPSQTEMVAGLVKQEVTGDLTRPQLETLTIVAYRGPVTKPEIEQVRGVNCSLILRNLAMRGLVDETDDVEKLQPVYTLSADFLRHLGLHGVSELPDFTSINQNQKITDLMRGVTSNDAEHSTS